MTRRSPLRTVALLGRGPGLAVLKDALLDNPRIELLGVVTHGRLPKGEGGGPRPELNSYEAICRDRRIPLTVLDFPAALTVEEHLPDDLDLLLVLSWRFILRPAALAKPRVGGINLHRGALPEYAGAEPVRRAIEAGETRTAITAHRLAEEIDVGPEIARVWMDMPPPPAPMSGTEQAELIKERLLRLYAPLARLAIEALADDGAV